MKPTVIIVDDLATVREELHEILKAEFQVLEEAMSGAQAIESCLRLNPQLVVMDVVMPKMSGIEATKQILASSAQPPKIVMLSGITDETVVLQAMEAGASDYLFKPVEAEKLKAVLWEFIKSAA